MTTSVEMGFQTAVEIPLFRRIFYFNCIDNPASAKRSEETDYLT